MGVTIRFRSLKEGKEKVVLDIVKDKSRSSETTEWWRYQKPKTQEEKLHNKKIDALASSLKAKREIDLITGDYDFLKAKVGKVDFMDLFKEEADARFRKRGAKSNTYCCYLHFTRFTGGKCSIKDIDIEFIETFQAYLKTKVSQNCASIYYKRFKRQIERAVKKGMLTYNPAEEVANIQEIEPHRERLTAEEVKILIEAQCKNDVIKNMFLFSCFTGLRVSDLMAIKWKNIEGDQLVFHPVKTKVKEHIIYLNDNAKRWMGEQGKPNDFIFHWPWKGNRYDLLREWVWTSGISRKVTWHTARHTFATLLLSMNGNIVAVKEALGHSRLDTTMIYAKMSNMNLINAVKSLDLI